VTLKYPNCPFCKRLRKELPVDEIPDEMINDYHETKIAWDDFPKQWEDEVLRIMSEVRKEEDTHG